MRSKKNILIVEDELLIAEVIYEILQDEGYTNNVIAGSVEEAIEAIEKQKPDLVFTDIAMGDGKTGIDLGHLLNEKYHIPFIYITSHVSSKIVQKAKYTFPNAFLTKPFKRDDLIVAIEFALFEPEQNNKKTDLECLIIKDGRGIARIPFDDIGYLKAEKNYTAIYTSSGKTHLVRYSIADVLEQLSVMGFLRIHKSYAVNRKHIIVLQRAKIILKDIQLPVGRSYRESLSSLFEK